MEQLSIGYIDGMMLLPLIIEHTIDERSPLCGHTHDSLEALNTEIVITFEGTSEVGGVERAGRPPGGQSGPDWGGLGGGCCSERAGWTAD